MSDEKVVEPAVQAETAIDYEARCAELQSQLEAVSRSNEALFTETKKAKQERSDQLAALERADKEKSVKDGEFEKLWKSSESQRAESDKRFNDLINDIKQEKIQVHAMKLAVELADGNAQSAKLLSKFVQDSLNKISNERGALDESVLAAVKKEFESNQDYAPLISGRKSSGGGAPGSGSGATKTALSVTREQFDSMSLGDQRNYIVVQKGSISDTAEL